MSQNFNNGMVNGTAKFFNNLLDYNPRSSGGAWSYVAGKLQDFTGDLMNSINNEIPNGIPPELRERIDALANYGRSNTNNDASTSMNEIECLVNKLKKTVDCAKENTVTSKETRFYTYNIYASDIVKELIDVSSDDANKEQLLNLNIFESLKKLLKEGNDLEINACCELVCLLAYNQNIKTYLKSDNDILLKIYDIIIRTRNMSTKRYCNQIERLINGISEELMETDQNVLKHIMISYNHNYQEECKRINKKLNDMGFVTWMDINEKFNDLYDAMSRAIENAAVVLICYSQQYEKSPNCRFEGYYADKLNKTILFLQVQDNYNPVRNEWLHRIMSTRNQPNFWNLNDLNRYDKLVDQLNSILNNQGQPISTQSANILQQNQNLNSAQNTNVVGTHSVLDWTSEEVNKWFLKNNLENLAKDSENFTGITLYGLWSMKTKDFNLYLDCLKNEVKNITLAEQYSLSIELDKLNFS